MTPTRTGGRSGYPVRLQQAAVADADAIEPGPRRVRAVLAEHRDADGDEPFGQTSGPMFHCSSVPGRKFSTTTSAVAASRRNTSWPSGVRRSSVTLLRPRPFDRPEQRIPVDERTDLAHEVAAARLFDLDDLGALFAEQPAQNGAAMRVPRSRTRTPVERSAHDRPCSFFTASIPPALRASTLASAVGVFETNWCSMKW